MLWRKINQRKETAGSGRRKGVVVFYGMVRGGVIEKLAFERRHECNEGVSLTGIWGTLSGAGRGEAGLAEQQGLWEEWEAEV